MIRIENLFVFRAEHKRDEVAQMKTYDFSNTRCFIDFDSTLANSLPKYNIVLDELVKGKLTDKHYIEYYQDFGDAYDIIPGSPWKAILRDLVEYHVTHTAKEKGIESGTSEWTDLYFTSFAYVARDIEPGDPIGAEYGSELEEALIVDITTKFDESCARMFPKLGYDELSNSASCTRRWVGTSSSIQEPTKPF